MKSWFWATANGIAWDRFSCLVRVTALLASTRNMEIYLAWHIGKHYNFPRKTSKVLYALNISVLISAGFLLKFSACVFSRKTYFSIVSFQFVSGIGSVQEQNIKDQKSHNLLPHPPLILPCRKFSKVYPSCLHSKDLNQHKLVQWNESDTVAGCSQIPGLSSAILQSN